MSTTVSTDLSWFPLVPRPRPPCRPLQERVAELSSLAAGIEHGTCQQRATCAAEVLNKAALIASDCGVPDLARELCRRQYELFAQSAPLPAWAVRLALQPVLNIPRQLIRGDRPDDAYAILEALHHAAVNRAVATVDGTHIDFAALTTMADGRREACTLTWTALLADGTRALARAGRWAEAAERATALRGTGTRLLDGRQAAILALLTSGHPSQAAAIAKKSEPTQPWEHTVQDVFRVLCQRATGDTLEPATTAMLTTACTLVQTQDTATAAARTRIGLVALDLADPGDPVHRSVLRDALIASGHADGYAARDLLASPSMSKTITSAQRLDLEALVRTCGLSAGVIPCHLRTQVTDAADRAAHALERQCRNRPGYERMAGQREMSHASGG
jgi:hypothetical protein